MVKGVVIRVMRVQYIALVLLNLILFATTGFAQISLSSDVQPRRGDQNTIFRFTVTVEGAQSAINFGDAPLLSGGDDFSLRLVGPQSSVVITNGNVASKTIYHYRLTPRKAGSITTPSVELDTATGKLTAPPISVEVSPGAAAGSLPGQTAPGGNGGDWQRKFFLEQNVNPSEGKIYVGQQIVNTVTLYTQLQAQDIHLDDLTTDGFWQETLSDDERSSIRINGEEFGSIQILKSLYPLRAGEISIPTRTLTAKIPDTPSRSRSPFGPSVSGFDDDIFGNFFGFVEMRDVSVSSRALSVKVSPLPTPPQSIAPLLSTVPIVGDTKIKVDYSLDVLKVGGSKSVTIQVESEGNLHPLKALPFKVPPEIKVYEERPETILDKNGPRVKMIKRFRYTLVPLRTGYFTVPSPSLGFFNARAERYEVTKGDDVAFVVQGGGGSRSEALDATSAAPPAPSDNNISGGKDSVIPQPPSNQPGASDLSPSESPSLITTPFPSPNPAPPIYEERTLLDKARAGISVGAIVLICLILGVVVGLMVFVKVKSASGASDRAEKEAILRANHHSEIEGTIREVIGQKLSILDAKTLPLQQLKDALQRKASQLAAQVNLADGPQKRAKQLSNEYELLVAILSLLDKLERGAYSSDRSSAELALDECKHRALEILKSAQ